MALAIYFLYVEIGPSVFSGLAVLLFLLPMNAVVWNKVEKAQVRLLGLENTTYIYFDR